jgi:hypothetical protein
VGEGGEGGGVEGGGGGLSGLGSKEGKPTRGRANRDEHRRGRVTQAMAQEEVAKESAREVRSLTEVTSRREASGE